MTTQQEIDWNLPGEDGLRALTRIKLGITASKINGVAIARFA